MFSTATVWDEPGETSLNNTAHTGSTHRKHSTSSATSQDGYVTAVVAVKQCRGEGITADEKRDFVAEAQCMRPFHHPNVVQLLGVVTQSVQIL